MKRAPAGTWYFPELFMMNALTFDVEDWFCAHNLHGVVRRSEWSRSTPRVTETTRRILALLQEHGVQATFFVLGWIAEHHPALVREIRDGGHEIATHGYSHTPLTAMTPETFERDLDRALAVTRPLAGHDIAGFRAPSFTITSSTLWALDILKSRNILYDSSVVPTGLHPDYGIPDAPLAMYQHQNTLIEIPLSCVEIAGRRIPCAGGAYFRFFPYSITRHFIDRTHREGRPVIFYLHPWEIDPGQPRLRLPLLRTIRQYYNLEKTFAKLEQLLLDYRFTSIRTLTGI